MLSPKKRKLIFCAVTEHKFVWESVIMALKTGAVIIAADGGNQKKPMYMNELLSVPLISYVLSYSASGEAEKTALAVKSTDFVPDGIKDGLDVFVSPNAEKDSDYLLSAADYISNFDYIYVLYGNVPLLSGKSLKNALSLCISEKAKAAAIFSRQSSGEEVIGAYVFSSETLVPLLKDGSHSAAELLSEACKNGEKTAKYDTQTFSETLPVYDMRSLHNISEILRISEIERQLDCGVNIPCFDGVMISPNVKIGEGTLILPGTVLSGKVTIGKNCTVGPNTILRDTVVGDDAYLNSVQSFDAKIMSGVNIGPFVHIRPNSVIGEKVHLGNFVEVKNSNIDTGTKVSHLTYVGDSDVGKRVNFGCGTVTVNYTGKAKFRTTIGDDAFIGCNTNLVAPVTVGDGAYTAAGSTITEDVPGDSLGIARARQVNKIGWCLKDK